MSDDTPGFTPAGLAMRMFDEWESKRQQQAQWQARQNALDHGDPRLSSAPLGAAPPSRATVGAGPYGLPSLPSIADRPPEFSNAPTVAQQMQARPVMSTAPLTAAADVTGVPWWLRGGEPPDTSRKGMGEFVREGAPAALGLLPAARYFPKTTGAGALAGGLTFGTNPAESDVPLTRQQRREMEMERLRQERQNAADRAAAEQKARLEQQGKDAEAKRLIEQQRAQAEFDREQADIRANTPFKELHPNASTGIAATGMALAPIFAGMIKGGAVSKYNAALNEINRRWGLAVTRANAARTPSTRALATTRAQELGNEFDALKAKGPGGTLPAVASGFGSAELGLNLPYVFDYASMRPGSELEKKTKATLQDPYGIAGRVGLGMGTGGTLGELASLLMGSRKANPAGYRAETNALGGLPGAAPTPLGPAGGPGGSPASQASPSVIDRLRQLLPWPRQPEPTHHSTRQNRQGGRFSGGFVDEP